jgi:23S rRNA (uracil1939-C5)-methyltransferase
MLRHSVAADRWMVNIVTAAPDRQGLAPLAEHLLAAYPAVSSIINNVTARKAGVAAGEFEETLAGKSHLTDRIGSFEFDISANSFFQTNTRGAGRLYEVVEDYAALDGCQTVVDLYSGTGTIPIVLSAFARHITGIEIAAGAVEDAQKNCTKNAIVNCDFIQGDIKKVLPGVSQTPDVLIIDPPRAGMHKDVVKQVQKMGADRIVYVSCNPATLARDLALLMDDYRVQEVQPVDMFPHTYHVEAVAKLDKK